MSFSTQILVHIAFISGKREPKVYRRLELGTVRYILYAC